MAVKNPAILLGVLLILFLFFFQYFFMSNDYTNLQLFGLILYHIFKTYLKLNKIK